MAPEPRQDLAGLCSRNGRLDMAFDARGGGRQVILHLYDGAGCTLDVPCSEEQWALYKRAARREHMKVADWLQMAVEEHAAAVLAAQGGK